MLRGITTIVSLCMFVAPCWSQFNTPLTEPTNREIPAKIATTNVFDFCRIDQSIAYVPAENKSLVHQIVSPHDSPPQPLKFPGEVKLLSCSPDGRALAALVENNIHITSRVADRSKELEVPISPELESPSEFKWSADSKVLFAIRSRSPASVTRIVLDQSEPEQDITFNERIQTSFPGPTGDLLVAFSSNEVEIWRKGERENKIVNGRSSIASGSLDGRFIAFTADDKIQVWTLAPLGKGTSIASDNAELIRFSGDGKRLLISEVDDKAKCYTVSDSGQLTFNQEYKATSGCGWLSERGNIGACFSYSDTSRLMRVFRCDAEAEIEVPIVTKLSESGFDPDVFPQQYLLTKSGTLGLVEWPAGRLELFDVRSRLSVWGCRVPELEHVWLVAKGDRLLTLDKYGSLQIHDTTNGRVRRHAVSVESRPQPRKRYGDTSFRFQMLPDGKHCVVWCGATREDFVVIEIATQKIVGRVSDSQSNGNKIRAWRPSDDGSVVCVVKDRIYLLQTGFQSQELKQAKNSGRIHLAVKPFRAKNTAHGIYDTKSGQMVRKLQWEFVDDDSVRNWAHISRDGKLSALVARLSSGDGMGVEVRSTQTGDQVHTISLGDKRFSRVDFTRDQSGIWVVKRDSLNRFDFNTKTLIPFLTDSETKAEPVVYDPKRPTPVSDSTWQTTEFESYAESDTGWIATGHRRGFVNLWNAKDQKRYAILRCGTERVKALAFSPDGKYLVSWCADRSELQITDMASILPAVSPEPMDDQEHDFDF